MGLLMGLIISLSSWSAIGEQLRLLLSSFAFDSGCSSSAVPLILLVSFSAAPPILLIALQLCLQLCLLLFSCVFDSACCFSAVSLTQLVAFQLCP